MVGISKKQEGGDEVTWAGNPISPDNKNERDLISINYIIIMPRLGKLTSAVPRD